MDDEDRAIAFRELLSFWRDEAKLYAFSPETRVGALLVFLASVTVLIVLFLNTEWFGPAEDELKVRSIEFAVVLFFFPVLMAIDMFFRGGRTGVLLQRQLRRETMPYTDAQYEEAARRFTSLSDDQKRALEILALGLPTSPSALPVGGLEQSGFVVRDFETGNYRIATEFTKIIPRLVKEWRSGMHQSLQ